jgi:hypothetical protein
VADVVELHLLLEVPQQTGLGEEGGGRHVREGGLDDLRVVGRPRLLVGEVVLGVREGVGVGALGGTDSTWGDLGSPD